MKTQSYIKNIVTLKLNKDKCIGCKICTQVCPHAVFIMEDRKADILYRDACMECGACEKNCSSEAISVNSGVGCAKGIINGIIRNTEPSCDCSGSSNCC